MQMPLRSGSRFPSNVPEPRREREPGETVVVLATSLCSCYFEQRPGCSTRHCWKCHYNGHTQVGLFIVNEFRPACPYHPTGCPRHCTVSYRDQWFDGRYRLASDEERRRALFSDSRNQSVLNRKV